MFGKNLKYYRLRRGLSQTELASRVGIRSAAISNYEKGKRLPEMEMIQKLAEALQVKVADFLVQRNEDLRFENETYWENLKLSRRSQELILADLEEYFTRFFDIVEILGGKVLPEAPRIQVLEPTGDSEADAKSLRDYLEFPRVGSINHLISHLEDHGILVLYLDIEGEEFTGGSGTVNEIPYIAVNRRMTPEKIRRTIVRELVRLYFHWPDSMEGKTMEKIIEAISDAFLFPKADAVRELGVRRTRITADMVRICRKYGISLDLLVDRVCQCGIISESLKTGFHASRSETKMEESRIDREEPALFEQLVLRAVAEEEVSVQKGAELLKRDYQYVQISSSSL